MQSRKCCAIKNVQDMLNHFSNLKDSFKSPNYIEEYFNDNAEVSLRKKIE